jgi:hypothetical protein
VSIKSIIFAFTLTLMSSNSLCHTVYGATHRTEPGKQLEVGRQVTLQSAPNDCKFMMTDSGKMFIGLKSGVEGGFFFTEIGTFLLAIPMSKYVKNWIFKNANYSYVKRAPPSGVVLPVENYQTIKIKTEKFIRYVYIADGFNYIGDTRIFNDKSTMTLTLTKYKRTFYECQKRIRARSQGVIREEARTSKPQD